MRTLIVFNHPYEGSFCSAILQSVIQGLKNASHQVDLMHLDRDGFIPVMSQVDLQAFIQHKSVDAQVIDFCQRLRKADHLIFIFLIWWDLIPAMTKGFIDRVLSPGVAYDHHPRGYGLVPLLNKLQSVTIITTMNKPKLMYTLLIGNLIKKAMLRSVFRTMGYKKLAWISFTSVKAVSERTRLTWLNKMEKRFSQQNLK